MRQYWEQFVSLMSSDFGLKLFSVAFALGLWLFVNAGQKAVERAVRAPLEFRNVPADVMVTSPSQRQIEVQVMGSPALLSTIDPDHLKVVLDLDGARPGTSTFRLSPDLFDLPRGVRITRIRPSLVNLKLETVAESSLPVEVRLGGKLPFGYKVKRVEVKPETVKVRGPASDVKRMASVETLPLELEAGREQISREVRLTAAGKPLSFSPDRVRVSVTLEEEWMTKEFRREVPAKNFSGTTSVSPRQVYLRLSGPKRIMDQLQLGEAQVYLDLAGLKPGNHTLPLSLKLPPEVKVVEQVPARFQVRVSRPDRR